MFRSLPIILAALQLCRPGMPEEEAVRYATALQSEAKKHGFDPFTGVAIIHRESRWRPQAISPDGEDYGLAQIRARFIGACRSDPDPVHAPSEACQAVKRSLLDGVYNIRVMGTLITRNREHCRKKTGTALFEQWLASYEGRNYPNEDRWCQPADATRAVIQHRAQLVAIFASPKRETIDPVATDRRRGKRRVAKSGDPNPPEPSPPSKRDR